MNKKIKIVPLSFISYNYGGVLQYYALQEAIKKIGYDCTVLNADAIKKNILPKSVIDSLKNDSTLIDKISNRINKNKWKKLNINFEERNLKFDDFREKYINVEDVTQKNMNDIDKDCLVYICGSDQIWNPYYACNVHFFSFSKSPVTKMIYGASIGMNYLPDVIKSIYKNLLKNIDFVSVREEDALKIAKSISTDGSAKLVVDPVFLLEKSVWIDNFLSNSIENNKIFCYFMGESSKQRKIARKISKIFDYPSLNISYPSERFVKGEGFADENIMSAGPVEFLKMLYSSKMVITDSFHATAFSILFHKNFFVLDREPKTSKMISRISTLLNYFDLQNRLISSVDEIKNEEINWNKVDSKIKELRKDSLLFIEKAISHAIMKEKKDEIKSI